MKSTTCCVLRSVTSRFTRIINKTKTAADSSSVLANSTFQQQIGGVDLSTVRVPIGMVMLYGRLNNVWLPGTGFDLRHPLEAFVWARTPFAGV